MRSKVTRRAFLGVSLVALMALLTALAPSASALPREAPPAPAKANVVVTNGESASVYGAYADAEGHVCGFTVTAERTGISKATSTNLYTAFEMWDPDRYPCTEEYCDGWCGDHECDPPEDLPKGTCAFAGWYSDTIANADFAVVGKTYKLHTTVDVPLWDSCEKGDCPDPLPEPVKISVPIDITWERTPARESTFSGNQTVRMPGVMARSSGTTTTYSAIASGTFRGAEVLQRPDDGGPFSEVSYNHGTRVCRAPLDQQGICEKW